jgi:hypothetical protein
MKLLRHLMIAACQCGSASGQIVFTAADLPHRHGEHHRAFHTTNAIDVSALFGLPGGPQRWDFSNASFPGETVRRMDVVPANDGGHAGHFPGAAYAERLTNETTGARSWSYYRVETNQGRAYFGFYDVFANAACPLKVFDAPTTDLPDGLYYGRSWSRTVDFLDCYDYGIIVLEIAVHFISQAQVDAHGTIVLPGLGEVPALRVNELNTYELTDLTLGIPIPTTYFRNYYWLVRGVGKAVHVISAPSTVGPPPPAFSIARTVTRVFEASPRPVENPRIRQQGDQAVLDWLQHTNGSGYRVESRRDVAVGGWEARGQPTNNVWTESLTNGEPRMFFRVFLKP